LRAKSLPGRGETAGETLTKCQHFVAIEVDEMSP
jgi:hypothetical protein